MGPLTPAARLLKFGSNKAQGAYATLPLGKCEMVVEVPWALLMEKDRSPLEGESSPASGS